MHILKGHVWQPQFAGATFEQKMEHLVSDLNVCSQKGLGERFDSTIGAATVLMPYGGKYQLTPTMAMAAKLPVDGETTTCSGMAWGFNPYRGRPLPRRLSGRGREHHQAGVRRFPPQGHVPDLPGIL